MKTVPSMYTIVINTIYLSQVARVTARVMKTVPSMYTIVINTIYLSQVARGTARVMKTVPSMYTIVINTIYLSQVARGIVFRKHMVLNISTGAVSYPKYPVFPCN